MSHSENLSSFLAITGRSHADDKLLKIILSSRRNKSDDLKNVTIRPVRIKNRTLLSFVFSHATRDITKNYDPVEAAEKIKDLLTVNFFNADLFTTEADHSLLSNRKGRSSLLKKPATSTELPLFSHDKIKRRLIEAENNVYLRELGVVTPDWKVKNDSRINSDRSTGMLSWWMMCSKQPGCPKVLWLPTWGQARVT